MNTGPQSKVAKSALDIWKAGVDAVDSEDRTRESIVVANDHIRIGQVNFALGGISRFVVLGAGKSAGWMAKGVLEAVAETGREVTGWVNVPDSQVIDCGPIWIHGARSAGSNLPTPAAQHGTEKILELAAGLRKNDLAILVISGGGSALLEKPADGISLDSIVGLTQFLSAGGATISELNLIRKKLSQVKGGGLAEAMMGKPSVALVLSDVIGDPLEVIASGPAVADSTSWASAVKCMARFDPDRNQIHPSIWRYMTGTEPTIRATPPIPHAIVGNNEMACAAAARKADQLGFRTIIDWPKFNSVESADAAGERLASFVRQHVKTGEPVCTVSGGEPVVELCDAPGLGGRNQQLVLSAMKALRLEGKLELPFCVLSGGTDGEDGNVNVAGAWFDHQRLATSKERFTLEAISSHLQRNSSYEVFRELDSLVRIDQPRTNVCDLRVCLLNAPNDV